MATLDQMGSVDDRRNQTNLPVTQLDFSQAMQDFKTMFPTLEESVIEMVLRSNNGAVDVTIDQLLTITSDNEQERAKKPNLLRQAPPPGFREAVVTYPSHSPISFPPKYSQGALSDMKDSRGEITNNSRGKSKWNPPLIGPLPDNFLRITPSDHFSLPRIGGFSSVDLKKRMEENERQRRLTKDIEDLEAAQYLEDERMAIFLQNEEFIRELRHNKDFMKTLDMDASLQTSPLDDVLPDGPSVPSHEDDAAFKEKLKHMGKTSRKKFAHFAKISLVEEELVFLSFLEEIAMKLPVERICLVMTAIVNWKTRDLTTRVPIEREVFHEVLSRQCYSIIHFGHKLHLKIVEYLIKWAQVKQLSRNTLQFCEVNMDRQSICGVQTFSHL